MLEERGTRGADRPGETLLPADMLGRKPRKHQKHEGDDFETVGELDEGRIHTATRQNAASLAVAIGKLGSHTPEAGNPSISAILKTRDNPGGGSLPPRDCQSMAARPSRLYLPVPCCSIRSSSFAGSTGLTK